MLPLPAPPLPRGLFVHQVTVALRTHEVCTFITFSWLNLLITRQSPLSVVSPPVVFVSPYTCCVLCHSRPSLVAQGWSLDSNEETTLDVRLLSTMSGEQDEDLDKCGSPKHIQDLDLHNNISVRECIENVREMAWLAWYGETTQNVRRFLIVTLQSNIPSGGKSRASGAYLGMEQYRTLPRYVVMVVCYSK